VLRSQRDIARALSTAAEANVALLGIGDLDPAQSGFVKGGFLTPEDLTGLTATGAVGDIAGRIFTVNGELHANAFDDRIIGISFEQLHHIPKTLAVAAGVEKTDAIRGALHAGIVNILCTDDRTASAMLAMERQDGN
jgi:DNA-binding transcriptional regulator LsrR (DeoR family)